MLEMGTPRKLESKEEIKEYRLDSDLDLNAESNANVSPKPESECYDIVDSVTILIDDEDTDHLLFEINDLELTHISLDNGVLEIRAVQRVYQDIRHFNDDVANGRILRRTVRGSFN
jgi:hypothetical protein